MAPTLQARRLDSDKQRQDAEGHTLSAGGAKPAGGGTFHGMSHRVRLPVQDHNHRRILASGGLPAGIVRGITLKFTQRKGHAVYNGYPFHPCC